MNAIVAIVEAVHAQASAMPCPRPWLAALRSAAWLALGVLGIAASIFAFGGGGRRAGRGALTMQPTQPVDSRSKTRGAFSMSTPSQCETTSDILDIPSPGGYLQPVISPGHGRTTAPQGEGSSA
jgi:hypothetical protein